MDGFLESESGFFALFSPTLLPWLLITVLGVLLGILIVRRRRQFARILAQEKRFSHEARHFREDEFRLLAELTSDWFWKTDGEHNFVLLSDGFRKRMRTHPKRVIGLPPWRLDWQPLGEDWTDYRVAVKQRLPVRITVHLLKYYKGTLKINCYVELNGRPHYVDGVFVGYLGTGRDVTLAAMAENERRRSHELYESVVNSVREVVFRCDTNWHLMLLNRAWYDLTGHHVDKTLGHSLIEYLHPEDQARLEDAKLVDPTDELHATLRLVKRSGETRWIEITARMLPGETQSTLVGSIDDISVRQIAEMTLRNVNQELENRVKVRTAELEASNRELEAFSYSVSHDLRAPLRSIDGFSRIIEEDLGDNIDPATRNHLDRIRSAAERMSYLSDKLIELARFTRHPLKKETVDLSDMAEQIAEELQADEPERKVEFEITRGLMAIADKTLIRVVLDNLFHNAWKFTARCNPGRITFGAEPTIDGRTVYCVADNGAGFEMEFAANLFRPFFRMHDSAEFQGTGIGLANVRRIIERHGGAIRADAKPDEGARFHFTLSAAKDE